MTLPHRDFFDIVVRTLVGHSDDNDFSTIDKFTNDHDRSKHWGWFYEDTVAPDRSYWKWFVIAKSLSADLLESMDQALDYAMSIVLTIENNNENCSQFLFRNYTCRYPDGTTWDPNLCTGKYYDGVNAWGDYPQSGPYTGLYNPTLQYADRPYSLLLWQASYDADPLGNMYADYFCRNGVEFDLTNMAGCDHVWGSGDILDGHLQVSSAKINFLNPVVNSLSRNWIIHGTTPVITLTGLGFNQDDAELNSIERSPSNSPGLNWESIVDFIYFIGQQGQGTFTLSRVAGDFIVDSDTQIRIVTIPNLPLGTYNIRLFKNGVCPPAPINVYAYAGDWKADEDGLVTESSRFAFLVASSPPKKKGSMFFTKWAFKAKDGSQIFQYWAPIDVRSTDRFYDGRLISESGITRSIDDKSGLPNISDMNVDVAVDREIRQILAGYMLKNQLVELYFGWLDEPEAWKQEVITMIVDDHDLEGDVLKVALKDISQKYFRVSIPRYLITLDEYPNAHESAVGQPMPEAIGLCSKTDDPPGAIMAEYVDITTFKYLAARASLHAVLQVYSNGALMTEGAGNDYVISWEAPGRTYINFNADQGDNKITFNCEGYMFAPWDSANGYVQNPAYVIAFLFAFIAEVPAAFLDLSAIDDLAELFENDGEEESGYWIGQSSQKLETAIQELNFTFGDKIWPDREGRFTFGIKTRSNYQSNIWIFEQIDSLKPSKRKENLPDAINFVKAQYGYIPTSSAYLGSLEETRQAGIDDFESMIEAADSPWKFPWTISADLIKKRVGDEFLKRGYGVKEIHFSLSIDWIFDLDIFDSFIYQNPFAPTLSGGGEQQRYYYVKSLSFNFVDNTIDVIGIDLQWLLRQCFIVGRAGDIVNDWMLATEEMRMFGYIGSCITEGFADGEDLKQVCKCEE